MKFDARRLSTDPRYEHEVWLELRRRQELPTSHPDSRKSIRLRARVRSAWVTSCVQRTRTPSHLVSRAWTRWSQEGCRLFIEARCGAVIGHPQLNEGPDGDDVCDPCVLLHDDWIVYRYYDADGAVLYIGCTNNQLSRMTTHAASSSWWHEVRSQRIARYASRAEARAAESAAIYAEFPLYNVRGKAAA